MTRVFIRIFSSFFFLLLLGLPLKATRAASITVTETADGYDGSVCTLRNAIESVQVGSNFGGCAFDISQGNFGTSDTISLTAQTYILSLPETGGGEDLNQRGDLDIYINPVAIIGAGSGETTISGSGFPDDQADRIIHVVETVALNGVEGSGVGINVLLQGLTVTEGDATNTGSGGGISINFFEAAVNLNDVIVTLNFTNDGDGGGIENSNGFLTLSNSQVTNNFADSSGGGISNIALTVLVNSVVDNNDTGFSGGGILSSPEGDGGLLLVNSTVSRNRTTTLSPGGPIGQGGGIWVGGNAVLINSTISNNEGGQFGGGVFALSPAVAGNGLQNVVAFYNVTVAQNQLANTATGSGGGLCYNCGFSTTGLNNEFTVLNSLIAQNTATDSPDCNGGFSSGGYNLIGDASNCIGFTATGDQTDVAAPGIGDLQSNGGPTETHALLAGSPAIDTANSVDGCQAPDVAELANNGIITLVALTEDQRSFDRPIAVLDPNLPVCDIGAFEFQTFDFTVTKVDGLNGQSVPVGDNFAYTITVTNDGPGDATNVTLSDPLPATLTFVSVNSSQGTCVQASGTVTCDLGDLTVGATATVTITVTTTAAGTLTNVVTVTSQGDGEVSITKTAQATSTVQGGNLRLFGGGLGCSLNALGASPAGMIMIVMNLALIFGWRKFRS